MAITGWSWQRLGWAIAPLMGVLPFLPLAGMAQTPSPLERLRENNACPGCDFSYLDLSHQDFSNANLRGAIFIGANLSHSNLSRTDLTAAILNSANLSGTTFQFAILENASLLGAQARQPADFTGADMDGMVMPSGVVRPTSDAGRPSESLLLAPGPIERILPPVPVPPR